MSAESSFSLRARVIRTRHSNRPVRRLVRGARIHEPIRQQALSHWHYPTSRSCGRCHTCGSGRTALNSPPRFSCCNSDAVLFAMAAYGPADAAPRDGTEFRAHRENIWSARLPLDGCLDLQSRDAGFSLQIWRSFVYKAAIRSVRSVYSIQGVTRWSPRKPSYPAE